MQAGNNHALIVNVILFNAAGSIKNIEKYFQVSGTFSCDLDKPMEESFGLQSDFFWQRKTDFDTFLVPKNGAMFLKYNF